MRPTALAILLALLAACGGSKKTEGPVQNGGLTGAGPTGTVEGAAFTAGDGGALVVAPAPCPAANNLTLGGLVVAFSSYQGFCAFKRGANACGDHPSSTEVIVMMARAASSAPPAIGPGTYTIGNSTAGGVITAVSVDFRRLGATCADVTTYASVTGSVTIDQVSPTVKGSLTATFWSGAGGGGTSMGSLSGTFEAGACTLPLDICGLVTGGACSVPACIP
ncbi:MAG: hypothetical protein HZB56_03100 [Deltaproteobacteria bacterium]|nr:hypothetical protein [Deltaproteobacteria bacterium]